MAKADKAADVPDTKHIGADIPAELAREFRRQCRERGFVSNRVLQQFAEWWVRAPEVVQWSLYRARNFDSRQVHILTSQEEISDYIGELLAEAKKGTKKQP